MKHREKLENGLVLRSIESKADVLKYAEFNTVYNNASEGLTCSCLLNHHPTLRWEDFMMIEDEATDEIVSTTCLIPWELDFEGITLKTAQLEMVLSHPDYRKQGLVRLQVNNFNKKAADEKYDMSVIWGIPYYYRQYGYTYCIYGSTYETLPIMQIPDSICEQEGRYTLEKAAEEHIPALTSIYNAAVCGQLYVTRDKAYWRYLLKDAKHPVWIIRDNSGSIVSYITYSRHDDKTVQIFENGITSHEVAVGVLQILRLQAQNEIIINWPENSTLVKLAKTLGSVTSQPAQWLLRITDIPAFFIKIAPVLEKRIAASGCSGITGDITINLYKQAYRLGFKDGRLIEAENIGFKDASMGADGGDLCIPHDAFVRLVFGFRTLEQLIDAWPDIVIKQASRDLIDVLFPRITSYIHMPYHYVDRE